MYPVTRPERPALADFWRDLPRDGRLLISTVIIETLGTGLILPFGVVYLHEVRNFSVELAGLLMAVPAVVGMLVVAPGGTLIDRFGARRAVLVGLFAQCLGNVILAFATTAAAAAVAFCLVGLAMGVFWPAFNALIAAIVPSPIRQRYYGLNFTMVNLGVGLGGIIGGAFLDVHRPETFTVVYLANAASFLAPLAILLGPLRHATGGYRSTRIQDTAPGGPPAEQRPGQLRERLRTGAYPQMLRSPTLRAMLVLSFVSSFVGYGQIEAGATAFARLVGGVSTQVIGLSFAANTATIVVLQLPVLQRIEGRRRTRVIVVMSAVWALSWILLGLTGLVPASPLAAGLVIAQGAVFGFGETLLQPTVPAITNDLAPDHLRGRYNALMALAFQMAAVLAPISGGWLIGRNYAVAFIAILVVGCAAMALVALRLVEPRLTQAANGVRPALTPGSPESAQLDSP